MDKENENIGSALQTDPLTAAFLHWPEAFRERPAFSSNEIKSIAEEIKREKPSAIAESVSRELIRAMIFCSVLHGLIASRKDEDYTALRYFMTEAAALSSKAISTFEEELSTESEKDEH